MNWLLIGRMEKTTPSDTSQSKPRIVSHYFLKKDVNFDMLAKKAKELMQELRARRAAKATISLSPDPGTSLKEDEHEENVLAIESLTRSSNDESAQKASTELKGNEMGENIPLDCSMRNQIVVSPNSKTSIKEDRRGDEELKIETQWEKMQVELPDRNERSREMAPRTCPTEEVKQKDHPTEIKCSKRKVVLSPYFETPTPSREDRIVCSRGKLKKETKPPNKVQRKVVVSPYFQKTGRKNGNEHKRAGVGPPKRRKTNSTRSIVLTARQKRDEAYRRKCPEDTSKPPFSIHPLIQVSHAHDPWRVMVICMLLNRTTGRQVKKVLPDFFSLCPDAKAATEVDVEEIKKVIRPLGFQNKRAEMIPRYSWQYLEGGWEYVTQLPGIGKYAADAHAILCTGKWDQVEPEDHKLTAYWSYLKGYVEPEDPDESIF